MKILGKDVELAFTLDVYTYLCDKCEGRSFKRLGEYLDIDDGVEQASRFKDLACEMHKAAFRRRLSVEGVPVNAWPHYDGIQGLLDEMTFAEYVALQKEIYAVIAGDSRRKVETVDTPDGKKKEAETEASALNG